MTILITLIIVDAYLIVYTIENQINGHNKPKWNILYKISDYLEKKINEEKDHTFIRFNENDVIEDVWGSEDEYLEDYDIDDEDW